MLGFMKKNVSVFSNVCPVCHGAPVFQYFFSIHRECKNCGLRFEKEEGYFFGPMIIAYFVTLFLTLPLLLLMVFKYESELPVAMTAAGFMVVVVGPILYRYSKLVWLHIETRFDRTQDSEREKGKKT